MEYDVMGKKIIGVSEGPEEIVLAFYDGVRLFITSSAHVDLRGGTLNVYSSIRVTTDKVELKAGE